MNRLLLTILALISISIPLAAQNTFEWATRVGSSYSDSGKSIVTDNQGNSYVTGTFTGSASFGSINLTGYSTSTPDIFIAKMDTHGTWLWALKAGGAYLDNVNSITLDSQGNCIITGAFQTSAKFGNTTLISGGGVLDIFVAKINSSGTWVWAMKTTGSATITGFGASVDSSDYIYLCGNFKGTSTFGTTTMTSTSSSYDIFVAKISPSGTWVWAKQTGGSGDDTAYGIDTDPTGNCYLTGNFRNTVLFGSSSLTASGYDIFVGKLDTAGNWLWAKKAGGSSTDYGYSIAINNQGACYATGYYKSSATFGSTTLSADSSNNSEIFVAKLDANGNWIWANKAGGSLADNGNGIAVDNRGYCYIIGTFNGVCTFQTETLTSKGNSDAFMAKFDADGKLICVRQFGGTGEDLGNGMAIDQLGNCYSTGSFSGTVSLNTGNLTSSGSSDAFFAKVNSAVIIYANVPTNVEGNIITATQTLVTVPSITSSNALITQLPNYSNLTSYSVLGLTGTGVVNITVELSPGLWFGAIYYQGSWHASTPEFIYDTNILSFNNVDFGTEEDVIMVISSGVQLFSSGSIVIYRDTPTEVGNLIITSSKTIITVPSIDANNETVTHLPNYRNLVNPTVIGLSGSGSSTLEIEMGPGLWYGVIYYHNNWFLPDPAYLLGFGGVFNFPNVDFGDKGNVILVLSDGVDMGQTLPVQLSAFTGVAHTDEYTTLKWVVESELDIQGYNVLRNETTDLNSAIKINMDLIHDGSTFGSQSRYIYQDTQIDNHTTYYYWLEDLALDGVAHFSGPFKVDVQYGTTDPGIPQIPITTKLLKAFPNPFNPQTSISYSIGEPGRVTIDIVNMKGQHIRTFTTEHSTAGSFEVHWDGTDNSGKPVSSGVYLYRMRCGKYSASSKVMLMK